MFVIVPERPEHAAAIPPLLDAAFGPGRLSKPSYRFRENVPPIEGLSFAALVDGRLTGSVRFWPIVVGVARRPALLLGPLAVQPALKGQGIGRALMRTGLAKAATLGHRTALLVGDVGYYAQFGFAPAQAWGLVMPAEKPERLLALAITSDGLDRVHGALERAPLDRPSALADNGPRVRKPSLAVPA